MAALTDKMPYVVSDRPGYSPQVGRLVSMMAYSRHTLLEEVEGLTVPQLDHQQDAASNSIGALLMHIAAIARIHQGTLDITQPPVSQAEEADWQAAQRLGDAGRERLRGRRLEYYLEVLRTVRDRTWQAMRDRDGVWLENSVPWQDQRINYHWMWFHVVEDEISHCGQIRWLKRRLP